MVRFFLLAVLLAGTAGAVGAAPKALFHASFDQDASGQSGDGRTVVARSAKNLEFVPGFQGRALRFSKANGSVLGFAVPGNLNVQEGSFTCLFRPEWKSSEFSHDGRNVASWRTIFATNAPPDRKKSGALQLWCWGNAVRGDANGIFDKFRTGGTYLENQQFYHLALTWKNGECRLYVNGQSQAHFNDSIPFRLYPAAPFTPSSQITGFFLGSDAGKRSANGIIDEVSLYDKQLSADQIMALVPSALRRSSASQRPAANAVNPWCALPGKTQKVTEVARFLASDTPRTQDNFAAIGPVTLKHLGATPYLEAGEKKCDRFALRFTLPDENGLYRIDWSYPDDRKRSLDLTLQNAKNTAADYRLQCGVLAGDDNPNSGKILSESALFFARGKEIALIFMTARAGAPAALSQLTISRIEGGLPQLTCHEPGNEPRPRLFGTYFEDPALPQLFGERQGITQSAAATLDKFTAYLKFSGQNLLVYPMVWYNGSLDGGYNPRHHANGFFDLLLNTFDREKLFFMASVNQNTLDDFPFDSITDSSVNKGLLHPTAAAILNTGKPNLNGWHDSSPKFNILHADTQSRLETQIDWILETAGKHRCFKGIVIHITRHTLSSFGDLSTGYNDYVIDAFERDTQIHVPVDRADPMRGKRYSQWILANCRERWISWRCQEVAKFYRAIAGKLAQKRPDLILELNLLIPPSKMMRNSQFFHPDFLLQLSREAGIDPACYEKTPNLAISQGAFPTDYRWEDGKKHPSPKHYAALATIDRSAGYYALPVQAERPFLHLFDRYWESAVGSNRKSHWSDIPNPLKASWLTECSWRISSPHPAGVHAMRQFVLPLRYTDLLGITKGGYLLGTYGMEPAMARFARAFRSLPAQRFADAPCDSEVLRVRTLQTPDNFWIYVVNTSDQPQKISLAFQGGGELFDAAENRVLDDRNFLFTLAPYELRTFRMKGNGTVSAQPMLQK
ncbi:MAG: LamG domain-containing protein [Victivallaceae bacterium]|nr:LamG domain-containing protein [Victivallaceae bacterium]